MSWLFGSSKKKEQPSVTVDPRPIDGFYVVQTSQQSSDSHSLYPNINPDRNPAPTSLPYTPSPSVSGSTPSASSNINSPGMFRSASSEVQNQLESVPFRIASQLQLDSNSSLNDNDTLNEFTERLKKLKQCIQRGEFEYDFKLERNVVREAKMVNGHTIY